MAATLVYLHSPVAREGAESDETDKPPSAGSIDCNLNAAVNEKTDLKVVAAEAEQSNSDHAGLGSEKDGDVEGANNNETKVPAPQLPKQDEPMIEEKVPELISSNTTSSGTQNAAESLGEESSESVCNTETNKIDNKSPEVDGSSSSDAPSNNNNKKSYVEIKSKRKALLKIEKLTDSDNRTRDKMRRRALSPPSSSDEENLYIGWIAYPASLTSFRRSGRKPRREVWMKAVKFIFYPVTKVCQACIKNKVGAVDKKDAENVEK